MIAAMSECVQKLMGDGDNRPKPPAEWTHLVIIKTGDKTGGGSDGNIYVILTDDNGEQTDERKCKLVWGEDYEEGALNNFYFNFPHLRKPTQLKISRDGHAPKDDWCLEKVEVECEWEDKSVFPIIRWLSAKCALTIQEYDCSLPQSDKEPEQRQRSLELESKEEKYELVPNGSLPAQHRDLLREEKFSRNDEMKLMEDGIELYKKGSGFNSWFTSEFTTLKHYEQLFIKHFSFLTAPYGMKNWESDEEFGNQRLAGCNPAMIKLCTEIPEHMRVTDAMVEPFLEDFKLEEAIQKKKIYYIDYRFLADIPCNDSSKKLPGATALFYSKKNGDFVPIAIQLRSVADADVDELHHCETNPIFTPEQGELKYTWLVAKMWFNLADASYHQSATRFGLTHLLMESIALCTHRKLSPSHPIFKLLAPHFNYIMAINSSARVRLVNEGGLIDKTTLMGRIGMMNIIKHCWKQWNVQDFGNLLGDLKRRGVDDTEALPKYPYRDDALLTWNALQTYAKEVVDGHYDTEKKLKDDYEIQAWAEELSDENKANITGVPDKFLCNDDLIEVVTCAIFIGSLNHAATSFNQYDEYAFTPNYPVYLRGSPPNTKNPLTEADVIELLPSRQMILDTVVLTQLLSRRDTKELANFKVQYGYDPISVKALAKLREALDEVEQKIDENNRSRNRPYHCLHPKVVPNAITI